MAELPVTPTICLVQLAKTYQSPAKSDGTGVSLLGSCHLHPFPGNQRRHFQSWIQTRDLRIVGYYAAGWKKHVVQADFFPELISLLCLLPPKRYRQSELPLPKLALPTSS